MSEIDKQKDSILDDFLSKSADQIYLELKSKIGNWKKEADVQHDCDKVLDDFVSSLEKMGFDVNFDAIKAHRQVCAGDGFMDSLYGNVIIEYKRPDFISNESNEKKLIHQIEEYFRTHSKDTSKDESKLFGVGWDGSKILFVTKSSSGFECEKASEMTIYHIKKILKAIVRQGSIGKTYTAENLAEDFGSSSNKTKEGIRQIYDCINISDNPKASTIFSQWKLLFGEVCGFDVEGKNDKISSLATYYEIGNKDVIPSKLLFSVHTYYSLFMKLMAAEILSKYNKFSSCNAKKISKLNDDQLLKEMTDLENGSIWAKFNIRNLLEGDLFSWYLSAWNPSIAEAIRSIGERLSEYDANSLATSDDAKKDLLKSLYQMLFPKTLRHDLGEYYTPDWLAELVLNEIGFDLNNPELPFKRLLDPACGSGTFLVEAIKRVISWNEKQAYENRIDEGKLLELITKNIYGFDLNPLAVIASRVNYLLAIIELVGRSGGCEIPVFLCDSIMTPGDYGLSSGKLNKLSTVVDDFYIPTSVTNDPQVFSKFTDIFEQCIENESNSNVLLSRLEKDQIPVEDNDSIERLYTRLLKLKKEGRNGIWVKIIRNAFAPLFCGKFDFVAGNPPWVSWVNLPKDYRSNRNHIELWQKYDLFSHKGYKAKLGASSDDVSVLMTYVSHDVYLKNGGILGFVITQTVFKNKDSGEGFRNFKYNTNSIDYFIKPIVVHDLSNFYPFDDAKNRTSVFICSKSNVCFKYPIPYNIWLKLANKSKFSMNSSLDYVVSMMNILNYKAYPIKIKQNSQWLTISSNIYTIINKIIGNSQYRGYLGTHHWLNGVYWINVIDYLPNDTLLIENLQNDVKNKIKVEPYQATIEKDLVYPLLRGEDVKKWSYKPSIYTIIPNLSNRIIGMPEEEMQIKYPKTYNYFKHFEGLLRNRSGYKTYFKKHDPFYSIYDFGQYTLSPWLLVWRELSTDLICCVIDNTNNKNIIPDHKLMLIPLENGSEAHYICAILLSIYSRLLTKLSTISSSTNTSVLNNLQLPKFNPKDKTHLKLAELSKKAHELAKTGDSEGLARVEAQIDRESAKIWGITDEELEAIQQSIREMSGQAEPEKEDEE